MLVYVFISIIYSILYFNQCMVIKYFDTSIEKIELTKRNNKKKISKLWIHLIYAFDYVIIRQIVNP